MGAMFSDLSELSLSPVYTEEDTKLSVDIQVVTLDWLLRQITERDPSARISLVGFSLGGIIATRWASQVDESSELYDAIHAVVIIGSPVGGIPGAETVLKGCGLIPSCHILRWSLANRFGEQVLRELQIQ
jgi:pimeloyl-ACP methyl ester carboxylesterase